jgi:hypothetical protein
MNLVQVAKERCANWNDSNGRCFGISVEHMLNGHGPIESRDYCKLKDGEPCEYFERCVLSRMAKKEDKEVLFHYKQALRTIRTKIKIAETRTA